MKGHGYYCIMNTWIFLLIVFVFGVALTIYGEITGDCPKKYFSIFTLPLEMRFNSRTKLLVYKLCWIFLAIATFICCFNLCHPFALLFDIIIALVMTGVAYLIVIMAAYFLFSTTLSIKYFCNLIPRLTNWVYKVLNKS